MGWASDKKNPGLAKEPGYLPNSWNWYYRANRSLDHGHVNVLVVLVTTLFTKPVESQE
jgi:hypothetical protein